MPTPNRVSDKGHVLRALRQQCWTDGCMLWLAEFEDLRLMVGLMHHARGYTSDDGRALSSTELVRLLVLGGKLQVEACVAQCVDKVKKAMESLDPAAAMEVLESVPSEMDGVEGVGTLRNAALYFLLKAIRAHRVGGDELRRAWGVVIECIEENDAGKAPAEARVWEPVDEMLADYLLEDELKDKVADAVAGYLGPIDKLWEGGRGPASCWSEGLSDGVKVSPFPSRRPGVVRTDGVLVRSCR
jgi:hypothetical protein